MLRDQERKREEKEWDMMQYPFEEDAQQVYIVQETIKLETNIKKSTNIIKPKIKY